MSLQDVIKTQCNIIPDFFLTIKEGMSPVTLVGI